MAERDPKGSKDKASLKKDGEKVPPIPKPSRIPPPPPGRIPPPPPGPPLRIPPAPPRKYPPPPLPSEAPYIPLARSKSAESVAKGAEAKKTPEKPQGARRKVKSTPPPTPKDLPERARVSMNPAGRDTPTPGNKSIEDSPKKGFIRTLFTKAKDYLVRKGYLPLEQHDSEVSTPDMPGMLTRYTPLEDEAYRITPPRDIQKDSGALSKLLTKGPTGSPEATSETKTSETETWTESKSETSADNLGYVEDLEDSEINVQSLETSLSKSDAVSDSGSEMSDAEDLLEQTPVAAALYAEGTVETEVAKPISSNAEESTSELYHIKVNAPADIKVAYTVSGSVTTCVTYETADGVSVTKTKRLNKDKEKEK